MTLIAMQENNYLTNDIVITFTPDTVWVAAITGVFINGVAVSDYTISGSKITFNGVLFNRVGSYTILVEATGYDVSSVVQSVEIAKWAQLDFYGFNDLKKIESVLLSNLTTTSDIMTELVKSEVRNEIFKYFQHYQIRGERTEGTDYFLLDHIENAPEIRQAVVYLAISKLLYQKSISEKDVYFERFKEYNSKYRTEIDFAKRRLTFETSYIDQQAKVVRFSR